MANYTTNDVQKAYIAFFGRPAEPAGLEYWMSVADAVTLEDMHAYFGQQQEYLRYYDAYLDDAGNVEDAAGLLDAVYMNLFNREVQDDNPNEGGFWIPLLEDGTVTIADVVTEVLKGAQNSDSVAIISKLQAAVAFTEAAAEIGDGAGYSGDAAAEVAHDWLAGIYDPATEAAALQPAALHEAVLECLGEGDPTGVDHILTIGQDVVHAGPFDIVYGDSTTLTPGDKIDGAHLVDLTFGQGTNGEFDGQVIDSVDEILISSQGGTEIRTSRWTNIGTDTITISNSTGDVTLNDLQSSTNDSASGAAGTTYALEDIVDSLATITLNFDAQAVDGADTEVDVSVAEVTAAVVVNGGDVETLNLDIADVDTNSESTLADLSVEGISTLNITQTGGTLGMDFTIEGALDAGLDVINAATAISNLHLNVSESTEAMDVTLGRGDDVINFGDTLGDFDEQDSIVGGAGTDKLVAVLDTVGTRSPMMSGVEIMDITFNASATVDFSDVDGLHTINILETESQDYSAIELIKMDNTVTEINVESPQGDSFNSDMRIAYENGADANLDFTWTNNSGADQYVDNLRFDEVNTLNMVFDGKNDIWIDRFQADDAFVASGQTVTENLTITNTGSGDVFLSQTHDIEELSYVTDLTIATEGKGNLSIANDFSVCNCENLDLDSLERLTVTSSATGQIYLGDIEDATVLEYVDITSNGAGIWIGEIDGIDHLSGDAWGATISTFNITSHADTPFGDILIGRIMADDISEMNIQIDADAYVDIDACDDDMLLLNPGDTLTVAGEGYFGSLTFAYEAFQTMDFSGLVNDWALVDWSDSDHDVHFIGTDNGDWLYAGDGNQIIETGSGSDWVVMDWSDNPGAVNYINTGAGADWVDLGTPSPMGDADTVNVGGTSVLDPANMDTITGFNGTVDTIEWGIDGTVDNYTQDGILIGFNFGTALFRADTLLDGGNTYAYIYQTFGNEGYLFQDTDGDGNADLVIHMIGGANQGTSNFLAFGDIVA